MRRDTSTWPTLDDVLERAARISARVAEVVHARGVLRVNIVRRDGRPETWRAQR